MPRDLLFRFPGIRLLCERNTPRMNERVQLTRQSQAYTRKLGQEHRKRPAVRSHVHPASVMPCSSHSTAEPCSGGPLLVVWCLVSSFPHLHTVAHASFVSLSRTLKPVLLRAAFSASLCPRGPVHRLLVEVAAHSKPSFFMPMLHPCCLPCDMRAVHP